MADRPEQQPKSKVINYRLLGSDFVEFGYHALQRMKQRDISEQDVLRAVENPDERLPVNQPGRLRVRWHKTTMIAIDVVYEQQGNRVGIVTAVKFQKHLARRRRSK
jgi:hypothetical protein